MPSFGKKSMDNLNTAHPLLRKVFNEVIKHIDCSVICGERNETEQNKLFKQGKSKVKFPNSFHNGSPSLAVDVIPYPVDWNDREQFTLLAGIVLGIAKTQGINIIWGGCWKGDMVVKNNAYDDMPHFQLMLDK